MAGKSGAKSLADTYTREIYFAIRYILARKTSVEKSLLKALLLPLKDHMLGIGKKKSS